MTGQLLAIATRKMKRAPMDIWNEAEVRRESGIGTDSRGAPGKRQVSVLSQEAWSAACAELKAELPWTHRRANLLIEGIELKETVGNLLHVGETVLQITDETDPCYRMDELHEGLMAALTPDWRGGVLCRVISGGPIRVGDPVSMEITQATPE